jgi:hypothetical protein
VTDFAQRLASGLPLTLVGALAVVVVCAWLFGGVGPQWPRRLVAGTLLAALLVCWTVLLYSDPSDPPTLLLGMTLAVTSVSFAAPLLWKRYATNNT